MMFAIHKACISCITCGRHISHVVYTRMVACAQLWIELIFYVDDMEGGRMHCLNTTSLLHVLVSVVHVATYFTCISTSIYYSFFIFIFLLLKLFFYQCNFILFCQIKHYLNVKIFLRLCYNPISSQEKTSYGVK